MEENNEIKVKKIPTNRKELFFTLLRYKFGSLLAIGSYTFIFFIPFFVNIVLFTSMMRQAESDMVMKLLLIMMLIFIPTMIIGYIGLGGLFNALKKLAWGDNIKISKIYFEGVKENIARTLLNGFIMSLSYFLLIVVGSYLHFEQPTGQSTIVFIDVILWIQFIIVLLLSTYSIIQGVCYSNGIGQSFRNAIFFALYTFFFDLIVFVPSIGVVFLLMCFNSITQIIAIVLFFVFNPIVALLFTLKSLQLFDRYVNVKYHPEYVNKGLDPTKAKYPVTDKVFANFENINDEENENEQGND